MNNGGVLYSDLNLPPGASAKYICDTGYNLQPLHGRYEFTCTEDGIWDGNATEVPVECQCESMHTPSIAPLHPEAHPETHLGPVLANHASHRETLNNGHTSGPAILSSLGG